MEWGEKETQRPSSRAWPVQGAAGATWFPDLLMAGTCAELAALIRGLFLPPKGSIGFTSVPARLNHLQPEIMLGYHGDGVWSAYKRCSVNA